MKNFCILESGNFFYGNGTIFFNQMQGAIVYYTISGYMIYNLTYLSLDMNLLFKDTI